jgi:NCAIR mutase (PurE)-related protein
MGNPNIVLDEARACRIGMDEAILCAQKTPAQITEIVQLCGTGSRLFTRLYPDTYDALPKAVRAELAYDPIARTAIKGQPHPVSDQKRIAIVSAGSSDAPVVGEAFETLKYYGHVSTVISDVGVAGLWRLLERVDEIAQHPIVIAVAGMDAALPTVLSGLVPSVIIGVPTSTGYGAARNGETALSAMLASCGPGLTVTNIDNGYGAASAALRIIHCLKLAHPAKSQQ